MTYVVLCLVLIFMAGMLRGHLDFFLYFIVYRRYIAVFANCICSLLFLLLNR